MLAVLSVPGVRPDPRPGLNNTTLTMWQEISTMTIVRIFHNVTRDEDGRPAGYGGYQADHVVEEVFSYKDTHPANATHAILQRAFEDLNEGVNAIATQYRAKHLRSLSVGDVVQVGGEFYACDRMGWQPISRPRTVAKPSLDGRNWCFYVDESMETPHGFVPAVVFENESGFYPLTGDPAKHQAPWYWGKDIDTARRIAEDENARMGIDRDEALRIVTSSMWPNDTARD